MVNVGFSISALVGGIYCLLALGYGVLGFVVAAKQFSDHRPGQGLRYAIQAALLGSLLLLIGGILVFNGWRLDPILQFLHLLLLGAIAYLAGLDLVTGLLNPRR